MFECMNEFLSEENISLHREYYRKLKNKYSILEKSAPELKGITLDRIYDMRLPKSLKVDAIILKREIYLHEVFFDSFSRTYSFPKKVKSSFGSFQNLAFEAYMLAKNMNDGFLLLCEDAKGALLCDSREIYKFKRVILALDMWEHSYFLDYKFDREKYIKNALAFWNVEKFKQC